MIGFWCANCNRTCCWHCLKSDDEIQEIKTIGSRYCNAPECLEVERKECNCVDCRMGGPGHRKQTGEDCIHSIQHVQYVKVRDP